VTPLPSIKLFYLTPPTCSAGILPFGAQGPKALKTSFADNSNTLKTTFPKNSLILLTCGVFHRETCKKPLVRLVLSVVKQERKITVQRC
jgi:hypothetical protein